jgi:hypothetical protein
MTLMNELVADEIAYVRTNGPRRVVINEHGDATTCQAALTKYKVRPDIVYVRDDGWSLGAPAGLSDVALRLWQDAWIAKINLATFEILVRCDAPGTTGGATWVPL